MTYEALRARRGRIDRELGDRAAGGWDGMDGPAGFDHEAWLTAEAAALRDVQRRFVDLPATVIEGEQ